jgi:primosomal protein N''
MAEMVERLRSRIRSIHDDYRQASATLPRLMEAVGRGANEDAAVLAGKLGTQMDFLGQQISEFRIPENTERPIHEHPPTAPAQLAPTA